MVHGGGGLLKVYRHFTADVIGEYMPTLSLDNPSLQNFKDQFATPKQPKLLISDAHLAVWHLLVVVLVAGVVGFYFPFHRSQEQSLEYITRPNDEEKKRQ